LKPTLGCVPIIWKPVLAWTPIDPALAESPITASSGDSLALGFGD